MNGIFVHVLNVAMILLLTSDPYCSMCYALEVTTV